jgi:UDP-N-acetylmuramoyl-L-alanyl-D-glutamate--2,6-diaminopimelate ligase
MELSRLAAAASGRVVGASTPVTDLAYRAQDAAPGSLFVCLRGASADGHDFAPAALDRGAAALAVDHELDLPAPQIVVADTRVAMARLATEFFGDPSAELDVVGVTGTSGKTTTTFLVHAILDAAGRRPGLLGTIESRIGDERRPAVRTTPESVDLQRTLRAMVEAGNRSAAMEATSHGSEQHRLDGVRFAALAFTNLGQDHLDFHGTMERYFEAKRRLFDPGPPAAVNVGDEWGRRLAAGLRGDRLLTFGFADDADLRPERLELTASGAAFTAGGLEIRTRLRGRFNVENALAAIALARLVGVDDEAIVAGLAAVDGVPGRFEAVDEGQPFTVVVDYSHKPDALANVLETARALAAGRVICVFGAGGDRDRAKRPVMGRIAADLADVAILTSDNPRSEDPRAIADEVAAGAPGELELILDRRAAILRAVELAAPGDVVVIAGKGHEQGQETAGRIEPFDDREVAREAIRALGARA